MTQSKQIMVDELDFDAIKVNLKLALQSYPGFTDYNYDGSAMSVLLDILAYNTHYNALYTNLAVNEMFLDSASKLSSATSLAKTIGYTPKSKIASTATVNVSVTNVPNNPATLTMPMGTTFRAENSGVEYQFITTSDITVPKGLSNTYTFNDVLLVQGAPINQGYTASEERRYVIPNNDVDMTRLTVRVYESPNSSNFEVYNFAEDVLKIRTTDKVYFVKQREDLFYEIFFGNNAIGYAVPNGSRVVIQYYITEGADANGCKEFYYAGGWEPVQYFSVSVVSAASGGASAETRDSIKYNAPRYYKAQHRAVTASDYESILKEKYPTIQAIRVWGGEDNVPPVYGKIFVCAKPTDRAAFTEEEKISMMYWLRTNRSVLAIQPVFVDPTLLKAEVTTNVYYDPVITIDSPNTIKSYVLAAIDDYASGLNQFDTNLRYSSLVSAIDSAHSSITNNITTIRVRTSVTPYPGTTSKYTVQLNNPIRNNQIGRNIWTSRFYTMTYTDRAHISDDAEGNLWVFTEDQYGQATRRFKCGTVNYSTGEVTFTVDFSNYYESDFELIFEPSSYDIVSKYNMMVVVPMSNASVNVITKNSGINSAIR